MELLDREITVRRYALFLVGALIFGSAVTGHFGYQAGLDQGYDNGQQEMALEMEQSPSTVVFRQESGLNRSIGVSWDSLDYSYGCRFSGMDEVQISQFTWKYEDGSDCRFIEGDVSEKWDSPDFNNTRTEINELNESESQ